MIKDSIVTIRAACSCLFFLGPCNTYEVFFPQGENLASGIGSCYLINHNGNVRFHEANSVCLDSTNRGSLKSPFSQSDPEYNLLMGAINFLKVFGPGDR